MRISISSTLTPGFSHSHKTKTAITPGTIEFYITHDLQQLYRFSQKFGSSV